MSPQERRTYILNLLNEKPIVTVTELADAFSLSEVSVRKLLSGMEKDGLLSRSWGGAVRRENALHEFSHAEKENRHLEEKLAIAQYCYDQIHDEESVFLDSGTTTIQIARLIAKGDKRHVVVITNALNVALEFERTEDISVLLIGGEFRHRIVCCTGDLAMSALSRLSFDRSFISGNHFSMERGFTTPLLSEAAMKGCVIERSKYSYVVMDSSKYGENSLSRIAPIDAVTQIVTDWKLPESIVRHFQINGVNLVAVPPIQSQR